MDRWRGRVALVTGASVGIGAAVAVELVRSGMIVVGCARSVDKIEKLAAECQRAGHSGVLVPFKCDLTKEEEILSMFAAFKEQHKGVDVCINNAGLAHPESLLSGKTSGWKNMTDVNVLGLSICTREAYQSMKERNVDDGHIININSMCGHQVFPITDLHFYTATKFAVTALTEGLRQELRAENTHIRATSISPGLVKTEFASNLYNPEKAAELYSAYKSLEATDVASAVVYVLSAPPHVQQVTGVLVLMDRWRGRVALVTGASVGIGAAVAVELVRSGMVVVGCARSVEKIEKLAAECKRAGHSGVLVPFKCDLTKEEDILSMFAAIKAQHKGVDVCINNAGLAYPEPLLSGKTSGWKITMDVNVLGLCICTREAYQSMKERNVDDGHIININSVAGHQVFPIADEHFYNATKYAVTALTEGLRQELRAENTHIRATSISPGLVRTEFSERMHSNNPEKVAELFAAFKDMGAADVVSAVTYVLSAPPHVQVGEIVVEGV